MAEKKKLSGPQRAAILMMSLGDDGASSIMKNLEPKEVQIVGEAMATLENINRDEVKSVVSDFAKTLSTQTSLGSSSEDYLRTVLKKALGDDKAANLIDRILLGRSSRGLDAMKWMEPRAIADFLRQEHPQIVSIVLSYLEADQAAEVLSLMPENTRADLVMRIASLDGIQPSALAELDDILERQFEGASAQYHSSAVGGQKTAASILNLLDAGIGADVMENLKNVDEELGNEIEELMFIFDNLIDVDDRGVQSILREVSSETLILALKGADEDLKDKILKNMSKRAAEMLADDLEARGPVKLSDVEGAQKEILGVARRMADAGEISLGGAGSEEYV